MNRKLSLIELNRLSPEEFETVDKHKLIVVLDNIRSMHNVGSVFRTGDAFKIEKIILGGITPTPPHRDIRKTAIGATETVKWIHAPNTKEAVLVLQQQGYKVLVVEQTDQSIQIQDFTVEPNEKICLVVGNEVGGVDQDIIDIADVCVEIPQFGTKHSLNVSVCSGIVIWDIVKQMM